MPCCAAVGCSNRPGKGIRVHRFPQNPERRRIWESKTKRMFWKATKYSILCQDHFDEHQYERGRSDELKKLRPNAIPTIFSHVHLPPPRKSPVKRHFNATEESSTPIAAKMLKLEHAYVKENDISEDEDIEPETLSLPPPESGLNSSVDWSQSKENLISDMTGKIKNLQLKIEELEKKIAVIRREKRVIIKAKRKKESKISRIFNSDQLNALGKVSTRGCLWSSITVKKALQLRFACGTTGYSLLLNQGQPLPSMRTLRRRMENVEFTYGLLGDVFKYMSLKVESMQPYEKICSLTLDEMSITPGLDYDVGTGELLGDCTIADAKSKKGVATHALVCMLSGITTRWKQTVAYHFTGNSVDSSELHSLVLQVIERATTIGLHVLSITCDMGSANQALWRHCGITCSKYSRTVNKITHPSDPSKKLYFMADVPHLIKNLKAAIVNGNEITFPQEVVDKFELPSNTISKISLETLEKFQREKELKLAPKLVESLLKPSHFEKMNVGHALNLFSYSVSSGLKYIVQNEGFDKSFLTMAWFIEVINKWFDLMSSRHPVMALSTLNGNAYAKAIQHLKDTVWLFERLFYGQGWKPVQTGIILSTTSILEIQENLLQNGHKFILTSRFTQDCLENLFSSVRLKNPVPSALEFKHALKMISIAQFLKNPSQTNYLSDDNNYLAEFLENVKPVQEDTEIDCGVYSHLEDASSRINDDEVHSLYNLAGYCIKQIIQRTTHCDNCINELMILKEEPTTLSVLTDLKEYKKGALTHPSDLCFEIIKISELLFRSAKTSELFSQRRNILNFLVDSANSKTPALSKSCHDLKKKLLNNFFRVRIQIFLKSERVRRKAEIKNKEQARGSKSMAMRMAVKRM